MSVPSDMAMVSVVRTSGRRPNRRRGSAEAAMRSGPNDQGPRLCGADDEIVKVATHLESARLFDPADLHRLEASRSDQPLDFVAHHGRRRSRRTEPLARVTGCSRTRRDRPTSYRTPWPSVPLSATTRQQSRQMIAPPAGAARPFLVRRGRPGCSERRGTCHPARRRSRR